MKRMTIYLDDTIHKQIKLLCVEHGISMTDFIVSAAVRRLTDALKKVKA